MTGSAPHWFGAIAPTHHVPSFRTPLQRPPRSAGAQTGATTSHGVSFPSSVFGDRQRPLPAAAPQGCHPLAHCTFAVGSALALSSIHHLPGARRGAPRLAGSAPGVWGLAEVEDRQAQTRTSTATSPARAGRGSPCGRAFQLGNQRSALSASYVPVILFPSPGLSASPGFIPYRSSGRRRPPPTRLVSDPADPPPMPGVDRPLARPPRPRSAHCAPKSPQTAWFAFPVPVRHALLRFLGPPAPRTNPEGPGSLRRPPVGHGTKPAPASLARVRLGRGEYAVKGKRHLGRTHQPKVLEFETISMSAFSRPVGTAAGRGRFPQRIQNGRQPDPKPPSRTALSNNVFRLSIPATQCLALIQATYHLQHIVYQWVAVIEFRSWLWLNVLIH